MEDVSFRNFLRRTASNEGKEQDVIKVLESYAVDVTELNAIDENKLSNEKPDYEVIIE